LLLLLLLFRSTKRKKLSFFQELHFKENTNNFVSLLREELT
jgi:hypothetical protein